MFCRLSETEEVGVNEELTGGGGGQREGWSSWGQREGWRGAGDRERYGESRWGTERGMESVGGGRREGWGEKENTHTPNSKSLTKY